MQSDKRKYLFGPVPSRRLGRSLGVDLVPFKTCSYDCVYCQLGRTTDKTLERREYVPIADVIAEIEEWTAGGGKADYITLSGSGEPTLHSGFGRLIRAIKKITEIPVAVITNGSTLHDPAVREELSAADLVVPSLDAGTAEMFNKVNRPHPSISFENMLEGLRLFCETFTGTVWLEIFILDGSTSQGEELSAIVKAVDGLKVEKIQLNTVARPPAEKSARAVTAADMETIKELFGDRAEVVADFSFSETAGATGMSITNEEVLATINRRPCTLDDIAVGLDIHPNEALKYIDHLLHNGKITAANRGGKTFYVAAGDR